eukprot:TRINITY_DN839_c0_g1_i1.p1 TRINITY_DN839_c0_g1~~TRINITY_DN839_c0_g1_i1.p1  ORF type:complete len:827 (+),score=191.96 TRINITY_DN839_c0_g1_i1:4033-6513(+)
MKSRRQKQREEKLQEELRKYRDANPTVKQQFADLKADLKKISDDQWASIPDIGDRTIKKQKFERFTPVPDSVLTGAGHTVGYVATDSDGEDDATDLAAIGQGRASVLGQNLDRASNSVAENATVDADNYLSQLSGMKLSSDSALGDVKRARRLLECITETNPSHAPGWIAAARLEETLGEISVACQRILEGCRRCPKEEDVWVEAARMHHDRKVAKRILAMAVKNVPKSSKIWLQAAALEGDTSAKRRVLRKALEVIPKSVDVWKAAIELEDPVGARLLLRTAVESIPEEVDMWIALARLESYEKAKLVLQRALKVVSAHATVWVTAAQLEEAEHGMANEEMRAIMQKAMRCVQFSRQRWIEEAITMEQSGYPGTVAAIIQNTIAIGVHEDEREERWLEEANSMETKGHREVARAIYVHLTETFADREELWATFADFERRSGEHKRVQAVLREGISKCTATVMLWLMLAKDRWKAEGADAGRQVLQQALARNGEREELWLAAAKIETESGELMKARAMLHEARERANGSESGRASARVFMKSALVERQIGDEQRERALLEEGLSVHGKAVKLWLMLAQWHERRADSDAMMAEDGRDTSCGAYSNAGEVYRKAVEQCSKNAFVWIGYARWEERGARVAKARAVLERARDKLRGVAEVELVWRECVYLEVRQGSGAARRVLARALQECGRSGKLWAVAVALEADVSAKARGVDAIKACGEDAWVLLEVAKLVWRTGRVGRAREWMRRAVKAAPEYGDAWATLVALEREGGDERRLRGVETEVQGAEPTRGELWTSVSKRRGNERLSLLQLLRAVADRVTKRSSVRGIL